MSTLPFSPSIMQKGYFINAQVVKVVKGESHGTSLLSQF